MTTRYPRIRRNAGRTDEDIIMVGVLLYLEILVTFWTLSSEGITLYIFRI